VEFDCGDDPTINVDEQLFLSFPPREMFSLHLDLRDASRGKYDPLSKYAPEKSFAFDPLHERKPIFYVGDGLAMIDRDEKHQPFVRMDCYAGRAFIQLQLEPDEALRLANRMRRICEELVDGEERQALYRRKKQNWSAPEN
jgi:hypothetical protein